MTVTQRGAVSDLPTPTAARLREALASAQRLDGRAPLVSVSSPIPEVDPIALFAAARALGLEAALWLQPSNDRSIVGIGRAWAVESAGAERFSDATTAWRAVLADASVSGAPSGTEGGPTLLGALGFTGMAPAAEDAWGSFGPSSLVLPTFTVSRSDSSTILTVAAGPDRPEDPDPAAVERVWAGIVRDARSWEADGDVAGEPSKDVAAPLQVIDERPDRAAWDRTVGLFAGAVGRGRIDKVVLARRVVARAAADLDIAAALRHLARTAPESTTFAFVRGGTTFLGATPERLVRTTGRSFETVAIAGSTARGADADEDRRLAAALASSEKDREEHAVVVDMLRSSLAPIVRSMEVADQPGILPLRHIQHLVTPITGTLRDEAGLLALGQRLHPTPAVGGAPRDVALGLIHEHEGFDRGWYAGPIGWLGADGDGELVVALRCGLVRGPELTLFAGCGIVADSDPAREWQESRLKLRTMTAAFGAPLDGDA